MEQEKNVMASELNHHVGYSRANKCWFVRFYPYQTEQQAMDAVAAERARSVYWAGQCGELFSKVEDLKADNAAKDTRIKELETERTMIVSHATMGQTDGIGLTVNDISVRVSALRNELYEEGRKQAEALVARIKELETDLMCAKASRDSWKRTHEESFSRLEAKLAAANDTINQCRLAFAGQVSVQSAIDKIDARAVLGGKP